MTIDTALRDALSAVTADSLARVLARRGLGGCCLRGLRAAGPAAFVGPAHTLRMIPARGDDGPSLAAALAAVPEGAVVVVDAAGTRAPLPFARILAASLAERGVAGLVTDAALPGETALPAWGGGAGEPSAVALVLAGTGEPVACAGAAVHPGDIVVAAEDGVCVVPRDIAEAVALEAVEQQRLDLWLTREAERGTPLDTLLPPDAGTLARFEAEQRPA